MKRENGGSFDWRGCDEYSCFTGQRGYVMDAS